MRKCQLRVDEFLTLNLGIFAGRNIYFNHGKSSRALGNED